MIFQRKSSMHLRDRAIAAMPIEARRYNAVPLWGWLGAMALVAYFAWQYSR